MFPEGEVCKGSWQGRQSDIQSDAGSKINKEQALEAKWTAGLKSALICAVRMVQIRQMIMKRVRDSGYHKHRTEMGASLCCKYHVWTCESTISAVSMIKLTYMTGSQ
jgi:hypothetical protein